MERKLRVIGKSERDARERDGEREENVENREKKGEEAAAHTIGFSGEILL